jgi:hypothetical protein
MRLTRLLLLFVVAAAIAGIAVPAAGALTFEDAVCPVGSGTQIKVCPQGSTGRAYSVQMQGRAGTGCVPYVHFSTTGALPPGLTMPSNGLISGTPTQAGSWTFWVAMQDIPASSGGVSWCGDSASTERQFSITILQGLQIVQSQSTLTPAQLETAYSLQFSATGAASPTWSVSSGSLPAGLTLNSSTGLLAGTPTATGDFTFKIMVAESGRSDTQTYTLSVVQRLKITAPASPAGEVGIPFALALKSTGGGAAHTWSILQGTLPTGLTLDPATGAIAGTPSAPGSYPLKLQVTDSLGLTDTLDVPLKVAAKLSVVKKVLPAAKVGKVFRAKLAARGGVGPLKWHILGGRPGFLPAGIKFSAKIGEFSGTPTKAGVYRLRMQVVDKLGVKSAVGIILKVNA